MSCDAGSHHAKQMQGPHRYDLTHQLSCFGAQLSKLGLVVSFQLRVLLLEVNIMLPVQISSLSPEAVHALHRSLLPGFHCSHPLMQAPAHAKQSMPVRRGGGVWQADMRGLAKVVYLPIEDWHCVRCGAKLGSSGCYCKPGT